MVFFGFDNGINMFIFNIKYYSGKTFSVGFVFGLFTNFISSPLLSLRWSEFSKIFPVPKNKTLHGIEYN